MILYSKYITAEPVTGRIAGQIGTQKQTANRSVIEIQGHARD